MDFSIKIYSYWNNRDSLMKNIGDNTMKNKIYFKAMAFSGHIS
jgi:hypothetical protein